MNIQSLEHAARSAFERGESWSTFWADTHADIDAAAQGDAQRHEAITHRLLSLVVSGEALEPLDEPEGPQADTPSPSDTTTQARYLWEAHPHPPKGTW